MLGAAMQYHEDPDPLGEDAHSKYIKVRSLSRGAYGFVQLVQLRDEHDDDSKKLYAVKFLPRGNDKGSNWKLLEREIRSHRQLWHPHVVKMHEVILTEDYLGIVMEYVPGGNLATYLYWRIQQRAYLNEDDVRWIFQQMIFGLDYIHKMGVVNRDIKLENTLLDDPHHARPIIKLCDFGLAKDLNKSSPKTRVGTIQYMAPEVITLRRGEEYDGKRSDIWSCGVMLYTLLFGSFPFHRREDEGVEPEKVFQNVVRRITRVDYTIPSYCLSAQGLRPVSPALRELLQRILVRDPQQRIVTPDLMYHPWFLTNLPMRALTMNNNLQPRPSSMQSEDEVHELLMEAATLTPGLRPSQSAEVDLIESELNLQLERLQMLDPPASRPAPALHHGGEEQALRRRTGGERDTRHTSDQAPGSSAALRESHEREREGHLRERAMGGSKDARPARRPHTEAGGLPVGRAGEDDLVGERDGYGRTRGREVQPHRPHLQRASPLRD